MQIYSLCGKSALQKTTCFPAFRHCTTPFLSYSSQLKSSASVFFSGTILSIQ